MTSMVTATDFRTLEQYNAAFAAECLRKYPEVDDFELRMGFGLERQRLESAARVLACPVKANPPNWQHGRVLYAAARDYLDSTPTSGGVFLDIGTAKGFSAVVMSLALSDADAHARVVSVDVIEPHARVPRNSVAECGGELWTVPEFTEPFLPANRAVEWHGGGSIRVLSELRRNGDHVRFAFVDGKHSAQVVGAEIAALTELQTRGDVAVFDDLQIPGVSVAIRTLLAPAYRVEYLSAGPIRRYAVATRA